MSNPDPSPATRFGVEGGNKAGRKHTKDKLSQAFLKDLHEAWEKHGKQILEKMATSPDPKDGGSIAKIMAGLEPKELEVTRPLDGVSDDELVALIDQIRAQKSETLQ